MLRSKISVHRIGFRLLWLGRFGIRLSSEIVKIGFGNHIVIRSIVNMANTSPAMAK